MRYKAHDYLAQLSSATHANGLEREQHGALSFKAAANIGQPDKSSSKEGKNILV